MKSESGILSFLTFPVSTLQKKNEKTLLDANPAFGIKNDFYPRRSKTTKAFNKISGSKIWLKLLNCSDVFTQTKADHYSLGLLAFLFAASSSFLSLSDASSS